MLTGLLRRIRGSATLRRVAAWLVASYLRLCRATGRWEIIGPDIRQQVLSGRGRYVLSIWHGRLFMVPTEKEPQVTVRAIISRNRDGELITGIVNRFGIDTIRGSTHDRRKPGVDRGGRVAFMEGLEALRSEENVIVALTPDGPRGPLMRCQHGVASLSALTGTPVVPWTFSVARGRFAGSWDRFLIGFPFSRGVIAFGTPIPPPDPATPEAIEAHRLAIEAATTELTRRADAMVGRETPEPGPAL